MTELRAKDLRVRHDGAARHTPDGVSFTIGAGEVVLLLGPSGSGKSTLALTLNGLIPHALPAELDGEVLVNGRPTTEQTVAELSENVAMVFQDPDTQMVTGTVLDEVCFGPENRLVPVDEVLRRARIALERVGLWHRRDESPDRLSGGERQRLAIAGALAMESAILVLDEPTANLDPVGIEEFYRTLGDLAARHDRSILLIEHNLDAAAAFVDRVIVLDEAGHIRMDGPVGSVLRDNAERLNELGVWLPVSTRAALRLRSAGVPFRELPLTPDELTSALDELDALAPPPLSHARPRSESSPDEPLIRTNGLSVTKRGTTIVRDVSLDIPSGAFVAIVGTNGAGKTTLLQALAGVVPPPKGSVRVAGIDPATAPVRTLAGTIGYVFQNPEHQFIRPTVADELAHALRMQRIPEPEIAERVDAMLTRFGLTEHREQHPFTLSGGQKRRLSVGTALIGGAPILALDEPTFGQDRQRATELFDMLADLNEHGTTVVMVTHDLQFAADYSSHVAVMHDGSLTAFGTASAVLGSDELEHAGLLAPPLARSMRSLQRHPDWASVTRFSDLPGAAL